MSTIPAPGLNISCGDLPAPGMTFARTSAIGVVLSSQEKSMAAIWAVKDGNGRILSGFASQSRLELACKLMGGRCYAFRLQVSSSYRELFDQALAKVLAREDWRIVRVARQKADPSEEPIS